MKKLHEIRGLRYPDESVVRMFFKEGLYQRAGRVLEFGCGTGNNLALFLHFGWRAVGLDISSEAIANGRWNLSSEDVQLIEADLSEGVPAFEGKFDAILFPNINCYVPRMKFEALLHWTAEHLSPGGHFFIRARTPADWRYGRGREVEHNGFVLDCTETGEQGLLNVFYTENELCSLLDDSLGGLDKRQVLHARYDNPQSGIVVSNDDVVIWGCRR